MERGVDVSIANDSVLYLPLAAVRGGGVIEGVGEGGVRN